MKNKQNHKRKIGIAVLAGLAVTGIIGASAASLGGIESDTLGADVSIVGACDADGVTASYVVSFDPEAAMAEVDEVVVGAVNSNCDLMSYDVTLLDAAGNSLGSRQGTVALLLGDSFTVNFEEDGVIATTGVSANAVEGISIAIYGAGTVAVPPPL